MYKVMKSVSRQSSFKRRVLEFACRIAASGLLPGRPFNRNMPKTSSLNRARDPVKLEIVSHCWNYSHFLIYQLSSLVLNPPSDCIVRFTVFYSKEDTGTHRLLDYFSGLIIDRVEWNFIDLEKEYLFRRAIGRNIAAKSTKADWIWFTDCDVLFQDEALDHLAKQLVGSQATLVFPKRIRVSTRLNESDPIILRGQQSPAVASVDSTTFSDRIVDRAIGPLQITHGDIARACGYCENLGFYQQPANHWRKCYEDRAFRWLLGTRGTPVDIPNVVMLRHADKGRYREKSLFSRARKKIRQLQFSIFDR